MQMHLGGGLVYILAASRLAGDYLAHIVTTNDLIDAVVCDRLPPATPDSAQCLFVLDRSCCPLPLGECVKRLQGRYTDSKFVVVDRTQPDEEIVRMLLLGIQGFVAYPQIASSLATALHAVRDGELWVSRAVLQAYLRFTTRSAQPRQPSTFSITTREAQVRELARQRLSNKEIGELLGIRESTVKYHLSNIFDKLQVDSRRDLDDQQNARLIWDELLVDDRPVRRVV